VLNWEGGSVYSTTVSTFNARDQVTLVRQYAGTDQSTTYQDTTMSYDVYGRLQSKHAPEQNAGTVTTWTYNTDNTVASVTDARGATASYAYNARHLVTGISFAAPAGISVPAPVGFDYDAVGNRRWMTDGSGRVDYVYDQLSRLQSETRQFNGLSGSYTLSYEYNLASELKKITEPTGSHTDYAFDSTGRLTSVTDGASQYVSSPQYRAWGALKSLSYGNSTTLALSYNNRLQLTNYSVGGVRPYPNSAVQPEGGDFQYYADGRIKFASDLRTDATSLGLHDRAYSFDHVARLKEAYSGAEARDFLNGSGAGSAWGAFRHSYNYDPWNNLTTRTGRFWSEAESSTDSYNGQNRNPAWDYDADGRLLSTNEPAPDELPYQPLRFTFDASGRRAQSTQTTSRRLPINPSVILTTLTTKTETHDGDGKVVKITNTSQVTNNPDSTTTVFFLRSSVTGKVIAEYDSAGVKQNGYVFAGNELIAQQQRLYDGTTRLLWQHVNPITGDGLTTDAQGVALERTNVDPMGVNVGDEDPFISNQPTNGGDGEGMSQSAIDSMVAALIPGWGGPRCKIDGMISSCRLAFGLLSSGAGVRVSNNAPSGVFIRFTNQTNGQSTSIWSPFTAVDTPRGTWIGYVPTGAQFGVDGHANIFEINLSRIAAPGSRNMTYVGMLRELPGSFGPPTSRGEPQYYWLQTPKHPAAAFKQAVANSAGRLSGDCLKFFQDLSGITDPGLLLQKMQDYLKNNVEFGDKYLDGDTLQPTAFKGEGVGAIHLPIIIRGQSRPGAGRTYFNANSSIFTGIVHLVNPNTGIPTGNIANIVDRITPRSSMYGLSLSQIQQLTVLHELAHAFDPKGTWDDKDDTARVVALNEAIRKACF